MKISIIQFLPQRPAAAAEHCPRAVLRNPDILIMDEATSALDTER